jgi:hypothetical protein
VQRVEAKVRGGAAGLPLRPFLVWMAVAALLMLAGCGGAPAAADAPADAPHAGPPDVMARQTFPTSYPDAVPASDEVILKWNGTLILPGEARPVVRTTEYPVRPDGPGGQFARTTK